MVSNRVSALKHFPINNTLVSSVVIACFRQCGHDRAKLRVTCDDNIDVYDRFRSQTGDRRTANVFYRDVLVYQSRME